MRKAGDIAKEMEAQIVGGTQGVVEVAAEATNPEEGTQMSGQSAQALEETKAVEGGENIATDATGDTLAMFQKAATEGGSVEFLYPMKDKDGVFSQTAFSLRRLFVYRFAVNREGEVLAVGWDRNAKNGQTAKSKYTGKDEGWRCFNLNLVFKPVYIPSPCTLQQTWKYILFCIQRDVHGRKVNMSGKVACFPIGVKRADIYDTHPYLFGHDARRSEKEWATEPSITPAAPAVVQHYAR